LERWEQSAHTTQEIKDFLTGSNGRLVLKKGFAGDISFFRGLKTIVPYSFIIGFDKDRALLAMRILSI